MLVATLAMLAFVHGNAIYTMSADGSGVHRVTSGSEPAFSPSGDVLAFTRDPDEEHSELWVSASDGSSARRLVGSAGKGDGRRLLYTRTRAKRDGNYAFELRSVAADGSGDALFLRDAASAAFSPDGARIAFTSGRNVPTQEYGGAEVYTIAPDGSCLTWLTNGDVNSGLAAWAPGAGASAAGCGTDRPPRREQPAPARGKWWLGRDFGAAMLSSVDGSALGYDDCSAFDPRACPPPLSLYQRDMCHGGPAQRGFAGALRGLRRQRGALVGTLDRGDSLSLVVLAGRSAITVDVETRITPKRRRARFGQIVAGLRRVGSAAPSKLPSPRVDASLRKLLGKRVAVC